MDSHGGSMGFEDSFPVTYDGKQYDIKQFLSNHPGGINTLVNYKGKPVVSAMQKYRHTSSAYHLLRDFEVNSGTTEDGQFSCKLSENGRIIVDGETGRNVEELKLLEELESRLDWSKPILSQLHLVSDHYQLWVHSAVHKRCVMFQHPLLERLTFTPWYFAPLVWVPVILYMTWMQANKYIFGLCEEAACPTQRLPLPQFLLHVCAGVALWTALEYCLHRWVFHFNPGKSLVGLKIHFLLHGVHHKVPFDGLRLVFPPVPAAVLACIIYTPISYLVPYPGLTLIGGLTGFLIYDMIHYYIHHGSPEDGTYLYAMKRYHANHHFVNPNNGFGISSKICDVMFNSHAQVKKLNFSLRWR